MPAPRRPLLAAVGAMLVVTACSPAVQGTGVRLGAPVDGTPHPHAIAFTDCTQRILDLGVKVASGLEGTVRFGCGNLPVPLDYAHPDGRTISLAVIRVHSTLNHDVPVRSLLVNPGGPGASGANLALGLVGQLSAEVLRNYDMIGFDPRGVGESDPVRCLSDGDKDRYLQESPDFTTAAGVRQALRFGRQYSATCEKNVGSALPFFNTVDTARDMDQIRQAVGDDRMNYLGFSYGTELGWTYAHLSPKQVRTFVLDGAVDPRARAEHDPLIQLKGFEGAFDQFAAWCRKTRPCSGLGDPQRVAVNVLAAARRQPLPTDSGGRQLSESLASTGIAEAMYSRKEWSTLGEALTEARGGKGTALLELADRYNQRSSGGQYSNLIDANSVINCNDAPVAKPPSVASVVAKAKEFARKYPVFGADMAGSLLACVGWQTHRTPVPSPAAATRSTVLVVGNLHDPATPYAGAEHLADDLGHARLLAWNGEGHTSYLSGSSCVDNAVNAYLIHATLPPEDKVCPPK